MRLSILDDYQGVALDMADWSPLRSRAVEIAVERHAFADEDAVVRALADSEIVAAMRERTPFPQSRRRATAQAETADHDRNAQRVVRHGGIEGSRRHRVRHRRSGGGNEDTAELAWGLILGAARRIAEDHQFMRKADGRPGSVTASPARRSAFSGLGRLGSAVARVGLAFGMKAIAWSQNLTAEKAAAQGVERVEKDELFRRSDMLSVHLVLSPRSRGLVGRPRDRADEAERDPRQHVARADLRHRGDHRGARRRDASPMPGSMSTTRSRCRSTIRSARRRT